MSNELTTPQNNMTPAALAEMLGNKSDGGGEVNSGPRTSRLTQIQTPIMAMVEVNGKKMNMEALPVGTLHCASLRMKQSTVILLLCEYSCTVSSGPAGTLTQKRWASLY